MRKWQVSVMLAALPGMGVAGDTLSTVQRHPWRAAAEVVVLNAGVWAFDRYVMNEEFARIDGKSLNRNLHHGLVWDNDRFSTNLLAHPYHGGLYFNAARCNGMNFWESVPYSIGGSLLWELSGEAEPPSINDLLATGLGGPALGEVSFRLSSLVLDDTRRGAGRVWREALGLLINPVRGLNRLMTGRMWKVRSHRFAGSRGTEVAVSLHTGVRHLSAGSRPLCGGMYAPCLGLSVRYGDAFRGSRLPYDHFSFDLSLDLSGSQPLVGSIRLTGNLVSKRVEGKSGMEVTYGLCQFFSYYDSEKVTDDDGTPPYRFAETVSFGPGVQFRFPESSLLKGVEQGVWLGGILLGGSLTDHYRVVDRDYNMGSGYSLKSRTSCRFGRWGHFVFDLQHFRLFTWKGYEPEEVLTRNPLYLNAQGDVGNGTFTVAASTFGFTLWKGLSLNLEAVRYRRHTHYRHHEGVRSTTFETRVGISYRVE